jgi:hypothetical protein
VANDYTITSYGMTGKNKPLDAFGSCCNSVAFRKNGKPFDLPPEHKPDQQAKPHVKTPTVQPLNHVELPLNKELAAPRGRLKKTQYESLLSSQKLFGFRSNRVKPRFWARKNCIQRVGHIGNE